MLHDDLRNLTIPELAAPALFYANLVQPFGASHTHTAGYLARLRQRPSFARVIDEAQPYFGLFPAQTDPGIFTEAKCLRFGLTWRRPTRCGGAGTAPRCICANRGDRRNTAMKRFFSLAMALALASGAGGAAAQDYGYGDSYDSGYDASYDGGYVASYDNGYGDRYPSAYDSRHDDRYDNRYDSRYDNRCDDRYDYRGDSAAPLVGALLGSVIGNQLADGHDQDVATVAGAALGYAIASNSNGSCRNSYRDNRGYNGAHDSGYYDRSYYGAGYSGYNNYDNYNSYGRSGVSIIIGNASRAYYGDRYRSSRRDSRRYRY